MTDAILACEWSASNFLILSENVFAHLIYYSHLVPLILSFAIGFFIFIKDPKSIINKALLFLTTTFSIWVFCDLVLWAHESPKYIMFFWSIVILLEPVIYAACLYFLYAFITKKVPPFSVQIISLALLIPTIIFVTTNYSILGFNLANCDREVIEGVLVYYGYASEIIFTLWILIYGMYALEKYKFLRRQIVLVATGLILLLLFFASGNIAGSFSENWTIGQYGLFGMPIFIAFLGYLIVKFAAFNVKLIATQALVFSIWFLTLAILFVRRIENVRVIVVITLLFFTILGYQLIKSVKREIEAKEALAIANDRLRELDKQKTEFVSFATHQLRSPLTAIQGNTSLILEGDYGEVRDGLRDVVQTIYTSIKTMINVVEDYLNISRIELGTMKYNFVEMDFRDLVKEVVAEQKPNIDAKGLAYTLTVPENEPLKIKADPDKFKQVVMNNIDNSVKYTKEGSINITLEKVGGNVRLKIVDTGVGIAPDVIPKLFQKFTRAGNANEANIHGTGLGLFIAKEIMNAHGGTIRAESAGEGKGSQFYVEIPLAK